MLARDKEGPAGHHDEAKQVVVHKKSKKMCGKQIYTPRRKVCEWIGPTSRYDVSQGGRVSV